MPNISIVVPEVQQSVLRPIVLDIVRQLEKITKISKDSVILFPGELNRTYQPGSAIKESNTDRTQFLDNDIVQIEIEEDFHKDSVLTTAVTRHEQLPVFCDDKIGIFIKPVYVTTEISINFKFRSKSKTSIQRWRDDIRMRTSMSRDINLHQVTYSYLLPGEFINILKEIHRLREAIAPYGEDFGNYLVNNSSTRLTELSNLSGGTRELGIAETQMRIVGYFDFEGFPEKPEHDEDNDTWVGTFAYKLNYEKPIACNMQYPVMIHNQILSNQFRPEVKDTYDLDNHLQSYSLSINAFNYFEAQNQIDKYVNTKANIVIPDFDEFIPEDTIRGSASVFSALCQLTLQDKKTLINLKELGTIALDKSIIDFIEKSEYPYIGKLYQSILQVTIYRSMSCASQELVQVKPNLDICSVTDLDIRVNNRIRFSVITDLTLLNQDALNRLKKFPLALVKIIQSINEALRNNPGFDDLGKKKYIDKDDIFKYIIKPNPSGIRVNPDFSYLLIAKQTRDDTHLLSLLDKLIADIKILLAIIKTNNLVNYAYQTNKLLLDTQALKISLKDINYTDFLLKMYLLKAATEEIENLLILESVKVLLFRPLMNVYNDILNIINELQLENDGSYDPSITNRSHAGNQNVMQTSVTARDGIRGARIEDYKK
jgi:hypothetical protein